MKEPEVIQSYRVEEEHIFEMRVPGKLVYTDGHFPEAPVVPGVVLVDWAISRAEETISGMGEIREIELLKFRNILRPGTRFQLKFTWDREDRRLSFEYSGKDGILSSGRLRFSGEVS